jgi:outer membrane murein-binding lipoprotein Lpp
MANQENIKSIIQDIIDEITRLEQKVIDLKADKNAADKKLEMAEEKVDNALSKLSSFIKINQSGGDL